MQTARGGGHNSWTRAVDILEAGREVCARSFLNLDGGWALAPYTVLCEISSMKCSRK
jgi:hypothetical protein